MLLIAVMFTLAYQYRAYMGARHVSVSDTLSNISGNIDKAYQNNSVNRKQLTKFERLVNGLEDLAERTNLKPLLEIVIARTGSDLPYQRGYTLKPALYILIPRFVYPNKPDVPVWKSI